MEKALVDSGIKPKQQTTLLLASALPSNAEGIRKVMRSMDSEIKWLSRVNGWFDNVERQKAISKLLLLDVSNDLYVLPA